LKQTKTLNRIKQVLLSACIILMVCALCGCGKNTKKEKELREQAIGFMEQGDYSAAVARFNEALSYKDGKYGKLEIDILRYRAEAEVLSGDYGAAANTYDQLCHDDEEKPEYLNLEIICMVRAGEPLTKVLNVYKHSTELDPNAMGNRQALYSLGTALAKSGDPEFVKTARQLYEEALNSEGGATGEIYNRIGTLAFEEGNIEEAVDWFQQGVEHIQNDSNSDEADVLASLHYNIAICYEYLQDYKTAKSLFEEYAAQYGSNEVIEHEIEFLETRIRE